MMRTAAVALILAALTACGTSDGDDVAVGNGSRCGAPIGGPAAAQAPVVMTGEFTSRGPAGADGLFTGRVTVTNRSSSPLSETTASQPDVFVAQAGRIVALPPPKDASARLVELAPGASVVYDATGSIEGCADGRRLPPGHYEVYAELALGSVIAAGGPWPLELA